MKVYTRKDVDKVYSEVVAEYLAKGQLNSMSMGSSNGDIAHVDVAIDRDVYRIRMVNETINEKISKWDGRNATVVKVLKYKNYARRNEHLWDSDAEVAEVRGTYVAIDGGYSTARAYVAPEDLDEYREIHRARISSHFGRKDREEVELTKARVKLALRAAAKTDERGFKSFKSPGDVKKIEKFQYEHRDYIYVPNPDKNEWRQLRIEGTRRKVGYYITYQISGKNAKILTVSSEVFTPDKTQKTK